MALEQGDPNYYENLENELCEFLAWIEKSGVILIGIPAWDWTGEYTELPTYPADSEQLVYDYIFQDQKNQKL